MKLSNGFTINDSQRRRLERLMNDYRRLYEDPENATPMIIVNVARQQPSWREQLADPMVMLQTQLDQIQTHLEIEDDFVPAVRIEFGTAQVAAAFGCEIAVFDDHAPCARGPALKNADDIIDVQLPSLRAGWYGKLEQWTGIWKKHLPDEIPIQHPDIQSPFNNAHLVRGNDLLMDFYDHPERVELLLDKVTEYMVQLVRWFSELSQNHRNSGWFADWGAFWKGAARLSNCSTDMISPELYVKYVYPRDRRFLSAVGSGRIHYCGTSAKVIREFFEIPELTGLDCDAQYHNVWELAEMTPSNVPLIAQQYGVPYPELDRLLRGDWPKKRNIIVITEAPDISQARQLLMELKQSTPD